MKKVTCKIFLIGIVFECCATCVAATLEEIIVTSQRRAQDIQDIPIAVTVITGEQLEVAQIDDVFDISAHVPNFQTSSAYARAQPIFSIRGVSSSDYNSSLLTPVGVYLDEVYLVAPYMQGLLMFDLDRVELLRGPQGTLYGRNTTGGAINQISVAPDYTYKGYLTAGIGRFNQRELLGALQGGIVDGAVATRVAIMSAKHDPLFKNHIGDDLTGENQYGIRWSVLFDFNSQINGMLRLATARIDAPTRTPRAIGLLPGGTNPVGIVPDPGIYSGRINRAGDTQVESDIASFTLNYEADKITYTSITAYSKGYWSAEIDSDGSRVAFLEIDWQSDIDAFSQDFRMVTHLDGPINTILGFYYASDNVFSANHWSALEVFVPVLGNFDPANFVAVFEPSYSLDRTNVSVYNHTTWSVNDRWQLEMGLRYNKDDNNLKDLVSAWSGHDGRFHFNAIPPTSVDESDNQVTGKLGLNYTFKDGSLFYVSYSKGYRSGNWNPGALFGPDDVTYAKPEIVNAYELGLKTLWQESMRLSGAIFYYDYKDQQFIDFQAPVQELVNGEKSTIYGAEFELQWQASDQLKVISGLGLLEAVFDKLTLGGLDLSGNDLISAPDINFNLALDYRIPIQAGELAFQLDTHYVGDQFYSAFNKENNNADVSQEGYWIGNARINFSGENGQWSLALWVKNVTDKEVVVYAISGAAFGFHYLQYNDPRTWGVNATVRF